VWAFAAYYLTASLGNRVAQITLTCGAFTIIDFHADTMFTVYMTDDARIARSTEDIEVMHVILPRIDALRFTTLVYSGLWYIKRQ
jgi:hypothetical protein